MPKSNPLRGYELVEIDLIVTMHLDSVKPASGHGEVPA